MQQTSGHNAIPQLSTTRSPEPCPAFFEDHSNRRPLAPSQNQVENYWEFDSSTPSPMAWLPSVTVKGQNDDQ